MARLTLRDTVTYKFYNKHLRLKYYERSLSVKKTKSNLCILPDDNSTSHFHRDSYSRLGAKL